MKDEYDSPWKESLDLFLEQVLRLQYPDLHAEIDWTKGYESLDTELQKIVQEAELGKSLADKLFLVTKKSGETVRLLIHMEVQAQKDEDFERRMFIYHIRIFLRYNEHPIGLAILADDDGTWRPKAYSHPCGIHYNFFPSKLLDFQDRIEELETSDNPIGLVIVAHLQSWATKGKPQDRKAWKMRLYRELFKRNLDAESVRELFRLIDWFLKLPKYLEDEFTVELEAYQRELKMPYISSYERHFLEKGMEKGREEGRIAGRIEGRDEGHKEMLQESLAFAIEMKFGVADPWFLEQLRKIDGIERLREIQQFLRTVQTLDQVREHLQ